MSLIDSVIIASRKIVHDSAKYLSYVYVRYFKKIKRKYMSQFLLEYSFLFLRKR